MWNTVMYPCTDIGQACQWWEVKGMRGMVTGTCGAVILNTGLGNAVKENSYYCRTTCGTFIWLETRARLKHVIAPWKSHTGELMVAVISLMSIFKSLMSSSAAMSLPPQNLFISLYSSLVCCFLGYGGPDWGSCILPMFTCLPDLNALWAKLVLCRIC